MKSFRERFGLPPQLPTAASDDRIITTYKDIYRMQEWIWHAALERVLEEMKQDPFKANGELITWIKQELGETQ